MKFRILSIVLSVFAINAFASDNNLAQGLAQDVAQDTQNIAEEVVNATEQASEVVSEAVTENMNQIEEKAEEIRAEIAENIEQPANDQLQVAEAWARQPTPPNNNSAIYMQITNPTKQQITIIGAEAAVIANNVELHKSFVDERGVGRMVSVDKIVVPAESTIELAPGGTHIMLFDLKRRLDLNDNFEAKLKILDGEMITVQVTVQNK